jgi:hypothetical protein
MADKKRRRKINNETPIKLGKFYVSEKEEMGGVALPYNPTKVYEVCGIKPTGKHWRVLYRDKLGDMFSCTLTRFARSVREVPEPRDWGELKGIGSIMNDAEDLLAAREEGYVIMNSED